MKKTLKGIFGGGDFFQIRGKDSKILQIIFCFFVDSTYNS